MEAYLIAFVNWEYNDWTRLLPMARFEYNNAKNASLGYRPFKLNCGFYLRVFFENDVNLCSRSRLANILANELRELMNIYQYNLLHAQKFLKRAHNKGVKPRSYALGEKVWLNSKYIKTKPNQKLKAKFFGSFRILYPVKKQAYKLDLPTKWRIHDVFHVSLLEQDTIKKGQINELFPELESEFDTGNNKEYKVEVIIDSAVYAKEAEGQLPSLYYLISWKDYPEEKSTWEPSSIVMHLWKMISTFHKDHSEKSTVTSSLLDSAPPMAKPSVKRPVKLSTKQKWGRPIGSTKQAKEWDIGR